MERNAFFIILGIILAAVISSGCVNETPKNSTSCPSCTVVPTPAGGAAELHTKGFAEYIKMNFTAALSYYDQALIVDPKFTRAWIDKGNVLVKMNRSSDAVSAYDSALALDNTMAEVWNSRGEALMDSGNYTAARDSFDKALKLVPDFPLAKENRELALKKIP